MCQIPRAAKREPHLVFHRQSCGFSPITLLPFLSPFPSPVLFGPWTCPFQLGNTSLWTKPVHGPLRFIANPVVVFHSQICSFSPSTLLPFLFPFPSPVLSGPWTCPFQLGNTSLWTKPVCGRFISKPIVWLLFIAKFAAFPQLQFLLFFSLFHLLLFLVLDMPIPIRQYQFVEALFKKFNPSVVGRTCESG